MSKLTDFRVAVLATDGFEESELTEPVRALRDAGALVTILSLKPGRIQGVRHDLDKTVTVPVDRTIRDASPGEFDAVHLPGGTVNADGMRTVPEVQAFLRAMQDAGKPIAAICHAPWELVSAGLVRGGGPTRYHRISGDGRNAGGTWGGREGGGGGERGTRSPAEAAEPGGVVVTMVSDDRALEDVTLGANGLLARLGNGVHLSMSTVAPHTARRLADLHRESGARYVASPVFGKPDVAARGQ